MANLIRKNPQSTQSNVPSVPTLRGGWDPFRVIDTLMRWDPLEGAIMPSRLAANVPNAFMPAFDVKETKDGYVFRADLPGVKQQDLDISLTGNRLTLTGRREAEQDQQDENYHLYERAYGSFTRSFTLPDGIDAEHVSAELKDGLLTVVVPKRPEAQPKRISLNPQAPTGKGNT